MTYVRALRRFLRSMGPSTSRANRKTVGERRECNATEDQVTRFISEKVTLPLWRFLQPT